MSHKAQKTAFIYVCVSIFCALFGGVYEYFSHGVRSNYMIFAFMVPLLAGAAPNLLAALAGNKKSTSVDVLFLFLIPILFSNKA